MAPALAPPYWVKVERVGNVFTASISPDGTEWTAYGVPQTIEMADPALIGLAVTSHNVSRITGAVFSNISTTGNVSGTWEMAEIGMPQPIAGNDVEPLYVVLEDTAGNVVVVKNPNQVAAGTPSWREWLIPFSDLSGINLNSVATMYIGVGDRNNPTSGGAGTIFIDDIGYGRAVPTE